MDNCKNNICFLCGKHASSKRPKILYGQAVCAKCYYDFANRRQFAFVVDFLLFRCILLFLAFSLGIATAPFISSELQINQLKLIFEVIMWPIFLIKDGFDGQSWGKKLMEVQVVKDGSRELADFPDSFKRNLPVLIPFMPLIIGINLCKGKRFGDGWAKTRVIWNKYKEKM